MSRQPTGPTRSARAGAFIRSNLMGIIALYVALGGTALALEANTCGGGCTGTAKDVHFGYQIAPG